LFGKDLVEADARGKAGADDLGFRDIQQAADHCGGITLYVTKQEKQTLVGRKVAHCHLKVWSANITVVEPGPGNEDGRRFFVAKRKALAQLLHQCRIDRECVRVFVLLKGMYESNSENFFRFDLISRHIKREGEGSVTVAFVHISLLLLGGLFGSLGDDEVRFRGKLTLKVEQSYPASLRLETTLHPVARVAAITYERRSTSSITVCSVTWPGDEETTLDWRLRIDCARSCFTITVT
jgi:hypothetical protein